MAQTHSIGRRSTTVATMEDGTTHVTFHTTVVVAFNHRTIVLNHGGWMTATTRTRMNQASNQFQLGYRVFQKDRDWFIEYQGKVHDFSHRAMALERDTGVARPAYV